MSRITEDKTVVQCYTVELSPQMFEKLPDAVSEVIYALHYTADIFDHLQVTLSNTGGDPGLIGMAELAKRGLRSLIENEGLAVEQLGSALQGAKKDPANIINNQIAKNREK